MAHDVLVVGSLHLDVIVEAPNLPRIDETVTGRNVGYRFGGKGGNQAVAAARLGSSTAMTGRFGKDEFGRMLLEGLDAAGVDRQQVEVTDAASGMSVAIVDNRGEYGAVIVSGANLTLDAASIVIHHDVRVLLLQNEIPEETNLGVAKAAPESAATILNAAPMRRLDSRLLEQVDILVVNRAEAAQLMGSVELDCNWAEIGRRMSLLEAGIVLVTLGSSGLLICGTSGDARRVEPYPAEVVSTHGAGDAFVGALAGEIARGRNVYEAAGFAQAAAALHVSSNAERRLTITRNDVLEFMGGLQPPSEWAVRFA